MIGSHSPEIVNNMASNCPLITYLKEGTGRDTGLMCMYVVSKLRLKPGSRSRTRGEKVKTQAPGVEGQGG